MRQAILVGERPQGFLRRGVAVFIDGFVLFAAGYFLALFTGSAGGWGFELSAGRLLLWLLIGVGYATLLEGLFGATFGKMALGLTVVGEDGSPIGMREAIIRNVLRIADGQLLGLVGAILMATSDRKQRLGDRVARTVVIGR